VNNKIEPAYVSFEQAKWLKEKGFDCEYCLVKIDDKDNLFYTQSDYDDFPEQKEKETQYPEQWQVIEWLRVNHGIWVDVYRNGTNFKVGIECMITGNSKASLDTVYSSPQESYSAAFDYIKDNNLI
jgi:hypothetical protein